MDMILEHLYVTHRHVEIHVNSYNSFQHELKKKMATFVCQNCKHFFWPQEI